MTESSPTAAPRPEERERGRALAAAAWRRRPILLTVSTVVSAGLVTLALGLVPVLPAFLVLCVAGATLAAVDARTLRLPDAVLLPTGLAVLLLLGLAAALDGNGGAFLRALLVSATGFVLFLVLALVNPAGLGFGDVKLAAVLGLAVGYLGWETGFVALLLSFVLFAAVGGGLLVFGRVTRSSALPFGPFMLLATGIAVFSGLAGA